VENDATTIWERWDSFTKQDGFGKHNAAMNSFSHYSFGAVCEWMFHTLAGIDTDGPGFRRLQLRPSPPSPGSNPDQPPIDWVRARYDSLHGRIMSQWRRQAGRFELEVVIPANTTATVHLPTRQPEGITETGRALANAPGVRLLRVEGPRTLVQVESGHYRCVCSLE
jgi:alpha-L-rhamnosidase